MKDISGSNYHIKLLFSKSNSISIFIFFFREKGFAIDWCAFRLMIFDENNSNYRELTTPNSNSNLTDDTTTITNKPPPENYYSQRLQSLSQIPIPISRNDVPRRKISSEFLLSAFPALVVFVLAGLFIYFANCFCSSNFFVKLISRKKSFIFWF